MITGIGALTPVGIGVDASWNKLVAGVSGIRTITHFDASSFPCPAAGEIDGFDPQDHLDKKEVRRLDLGVLFALDVDSPRSGPDSGDVDLAHRPIASGHDLISAEVYRATSMS